MTSTLKASANGFPRVVPGAPIHGEIISWSTEGLTVRFTHLLDALGDCGLDKTVARRMLPRNAFSRACRRLAEQRIIRRLDESEDYVRFQFTAERKGVDELIYDKEAVLTLHKGSGDVECPDRDLAMKARAAVDEAMGVRTGGDITRIVQRLFDDKRRADLDLIPIRPQGGAYFVRKERLDFVSRVDQFLGRLNATMVRLPIAAGSETGDRCVREAVAAKMASLITEYEAAVEEFGADTRERTLNNAADRIKVLRHKVDSYATYLDSERGRLHDALARAAGRLRAKVAEIAEGRGGD